MKKNSEKKNYEKIRETVLTIKLQKTELLKIWRGYTQ